MNTREETELKKLAFTLYMTTAFKANEIFDFLKLSGLTIDKAKMYLKDFSNMGINNLHDVNVLLKLGVLKFPEEKESLTREEAQYQENIERLKSCNLSLFWEMENDPFIDISIKHLSGEILIADHIDKRYIEPWLDDKIEEAICLYKQKYQKKPQSCG